MPFTQHTEETKAKLREAWKRRRLTPVSAETRVKMSAVRKGIRFTPEHRERLSRALIGKNTWSSGRILTDDIKKKIAIAKTGKPKAVRSTPVTFAEREMRRRNVLGSKNPSWIDGRTSDKEFTRTKKKLDAAHRRALGVLTAKMWNDIKELYGHTCPACGEKKPLTLDHIVPVSLGGTNDPMNIQPLCGPCNSRKGTRIMRYDIRVA